MKPVSCKTPFALVALAFLMLAGCAPEPVAECEPGVSDLSTLPGVVGQNPC